MAKQEIHNQEPTSQYHAPSHKGPFERKIVDSELPSLNRREKHSVRNRPIIIIDVHRPKS